MRVVDYLRRIKKEESERLLPEPKPVDKPPVSVIDVGESVAWDDDYVGGVEDFS